MPLSYSTSVKLLGQVFKLNVQSLLVLYTSFIIISIVLRRPFSVGLVRLKQTRRHGGARRSLLQT